MATLQALLEGLRAENPFSHPTNWDDFVLTKVNK